MAVEASVVISMAAFDFPIMSRRTRTNTFVFDAQLLAENIQRVYLLGFFKMCELNAIVSLYDLRLITEVFDSHFDKENSRMRTLFFEREDQSFSGSFIHHIFQVFFEES
ncbi:hypothetical protein SCAZ3_11520 [Streptococcus canis FSL Z3-227]|uniref:Uncharacterized protein n=1 Tax=Streptococcus canis FSL Z3-227 TaxID=482234 RepID=A0AAV3FV90_STRCB|nr:hypothetical protein SCAZ3_11520 [Streptococcus canis FSL Z3-227]